MTVSLFSTSGANKSAILSDMQQDVLDMCHFQQLPEFVATDYTVESVMSMMHHTNGTALLLLDEMKKIKATDEYKPGGKQGSGNEKLMELQSGQRFIQIRKGSGSGTRQGESEDQDEGSPDRAGVSGVKVLEAQSHLNISGCTHMHTGRTWFNAEEGSTDGKMTRFDCAVVDAEYQDLPDRAVMETLGATMTDGLDFFLLLNLMRTLRNLFVEASAMKGMLFLNDEAYVAFQEVIATRLNVPLNKLKNYKEAGAIASSLSKAKGKILKLSGVLFLLTLAAELAEEDAIKTFCFEEEDEQSSEARTRHLELQKLVQSVPVVKDALAEEDGKVITKRALEYAVEWAFMFHETGAAFQNGMEPKLKMPGGHGASSILRSEVLADADAPSETSDAESAASRRPALKSFERHLYWGVHAVLTSKKFEDRVVSASYMTKVRCLWRMCHDMLFLASMPLSSLEFGRSLRVYFSARQTSWRLRKVSQLSMPSPSSSSSRNLQD